MRIGKLMGRSRPAREVVQSLWIGPRLSVMERLSICSFLRHGHPFHLYVYQVVEGVPPGATVLDANDILPSSRIFQYRDIPSYAGFANFFRYKLLLEKGGWYVDADTICLKPFEFTDPFVFSSEGAGDNHQVNLAAIKAPKGSAVMQYAWDACQSMDVGTLQWTQSGPKLITRAVEQCGLQRYVQPAEAFCPVFYPDWEKVLDPLFVLPEDPRPHAIHLWNEMWRRAGKDKDQDYQQECLYERLKRQYLRDTAWHRWPVRRVWRLFFPAEEI
ncbi:MAG: glycosyltransferase [Bryobacteraceae bacterium]